MEFSDEFMRFFGGLISPAFPLEGFGAIPGHKIALTTSGRRVLTDAYFEVGEECAADTAWRMVRGEIDGMYCMRCGVESGVLHELFMENMESQRHVLCLPRPRIVRMMRKL